jgi:hypothetical protein
VAFATRGRIAEAPPTVVVGPPPPPSDLPRLPPPGQAPRDGSGS